jgi:hypothetical protein
MYNLYVCKDQTMYIPYSPLTDMYHKILEIIKSITDKYVMKVDMSGAYIIFKDEVVFDMVSITLPMYGAVILKS